MRDIKARLEEYRQAQPEGYGVALKRVEYYLREFRSVRPVLLGLEEFDAQLELMALACYIQGGTDAMEVFKVVR